MLLLEPGAIAGAFADQIPCLFVAHVVEAAAAQAAQPGLAVGGTVPQVPPGLKAKLSELVLVQPAGQHHQIAPLLLSYWLIQHLLYLRRGCEKFTGEGMAGGFITWRRLGFAQKERLWTMGLPHRRPVFPRNRRIPQGDAGLPFQAAAGEGGDRHQQ